MSLLKLLEQSGELHHLGEKKTHKNMTGLDTVAPLGSATCDPMI